ncbi:MAG: hypothetical protein ABIV25_13190 [Paracoccaceae bacterium]
MVALDTSDPLVSVQPRAVAFEVDHALSSLKRGDRILAIDAAGKPAAEVAPIVDQCHPGDDDNVARNAFKSLVVGPIERHLEALKKLPASSVSPLVETLIAIAADQSLNRSGTTLSVIFFTDGLQNSAFQSAYRQNSDFPKPVGVPLRNVTVQIVLIRNDRDFALQKQAVDRFSAWLAQAGARVIYNQPGWLALGSVQHRRHGRRSPT